MEEVSGKLAGERRQGNSRKRRERKLMHLGYSFTPVHFSSVLGKLLVERA